MHFQKSMQMLYFQKFKEDLSTSYKNENQLEF